MNAMTRKTISGGIAGVITGGTAVLAILAETPVEAVTTGQWITVGIGVGLTSLKDWQALLSRPPTD